MYPPVYPLPLLVCPNIHQQVLDKKLDFSPICPAGPSARRTYCPLLFYPVALPLSLKIPNRPGRSTGEIFPFLLQSDYCCIRYPYILFDQESSSK